MRKFDASLHPRGKDGKFLEKLGWVKFSDGRRQSRGKVVGIKKGTGAKSGSVIVSVEKDDGSVVEKMPKDLSRATAPKASIDKAPEFKKVETTMDVNPDGSFQIKDPSGNVIYDAPSDEISDNITAYADAIIDEIMADLPKDARPSKNEYGFYSTEIRMGKKDKGIYYKTERDRGPGRYKGVNYHKIALTDEQASNFKKIRDGIKVDNPSLDVAPDAYELTLMGSLRDRVHGEPEPLVALGRKFDASLHPRGKDGKFLEKLGFVDFTPRGSRETKRGQIVGIKGRREGTGGIDVTVKFEDGSTIKTSPNLLKNAPESKARIDGPAPAANADKPEVTSPEVVQAPRVSMTPEQRVEKLDADIKAAEDLMTKLEKEGDLKSARMVLTGLQRRYRERDAFARVAKSDSEGSGSGTKEDPFKTGDVENAAKLLADGKFVELQQPDQVATLLDRLKEIVDDAKAKGESAPVYDLCKVSVPGTNLFCVESKGIPRSKMPQLSGKPLPGSKGDALPKNDKGEVDLAPQFMQFLRDSGIEIVEEEVDASHLRASQNELNGAKIAGIASGMEAGKVPDARIFVSDSGYVVDGHHRWAAKVGLEYKTGQPMKQPVNHIKADIIKVLQLANDFAAEWGIPQAGVAASMIASLRARVYGGNESDPLA